MSQFPVKASKAAPAAEKPARGADGWRARLGIALGGVLALLVIAQGAGWLPLSGLLVSVLALSVSQLQWANLTVARSDSAFRRNGRPLRRVAPPPPGQPARRLSTPLRAEPVYLIEAFAALITGLAALIIGAHALTPYPHPMIYLATASLFSACAIAILFPRFGAR
jgi:hypothetical protein